MNRICREVQALLPAHVEGTLSGLRRRLVDQHLRRCADCNAALDEERAVLDALDGLRVVHDEGAPPPPGLLESLLESAEHPGLRGRAAVPARGAVSGARPALSVALLLVAAAAGTAAGYAGWRGIRAVTGTVGKGRR